MDPLSSLYKLARQNMVLNQLKVNNITNPKLIDAFLSIARERFVPPAYYNLCYYDYEIKLNSGRVLLSPVTLARLLQKANPTPGQKALIIGGGTGYSTAVLSLCGIDCYMVESQSLLYEQATNLLTSFENVHCLFDNLTEGWGDHSPYDIILIDGGAVPSVPVSVLQQLSPVGGRLLAILNNETSENVFMVPLCQAVSVENPDTLNFFQNLPPNYLTSTRMTKENFAKRLVETHTLFECGVSVNAEFSIKNGFYF